MSGRGTAPAAPRRVHDGGSGRHVGHLGAFFRRMAVGIG